MKLTLIEDWKVRFKHWSFRLNAIGLLILGWIQFDPVSALGVWNMMPWPVAKLIPASAVSGLGMALFVLSMISKFVVQRKLEKSDG